MTDLAAGAAIRLSRHATGAPLKLDPALELGAGGEARVYEVPGEPGLVAKLYHHPSPERARKLALMVESPPELRAGGGATLAWPTDLLLDAGGAFAGFLMPRAEGPRVFELYNPVSRRRRAPLFHYGLLHRAGANLAEAFDALHARGYVVGDVNESNILLAPDGRVTLVDADSFQVRDAAGGLVFRSHVGKAEFTPPELQGKSFGDFDRAPEHDRFGLAVLLFLLLMEGNHPFGARLATGGETPPIEGRIRRALFPYAAPHADCLPPRLAPPFELLHPALRELFARCFVEAVHAGDARPTPGAWREALEVAEGELRTCARNPQHRHGAHLPACPWCARTALLDGRDPFPATAAEAMAVERVTALRPSPARRRTPAPVMAAAAPAPALGGRPLTLGQVRPQGGWLAASAGPAGVRHPGAWLLPAVIVAGLSQAAVLQTAAFLGFLGLLAWMCWKGVPPVRAVTALVALVLCMGSLLVAGAGNAVMADDPYAYSDVPPAFDPPLAPESFDVPPPPTAESFGMAPVEAEPELLNREEVARALQAHYPADLRDDGVAGTVMLRFRVGTSGVPDLSDHEVVSGDEAFVPAAVRALEAARFTPARIGGQPAEVWVTLPLSFQPAAD
jgi:TonB family protein